MTSQWDRLLKNQGVWIGSFTQLDSLGQILQDTPSEVGLKPFSQGQAMRQEIRQWPTARPMEETVLEYRSLGRGVLFCETGAFSQGALQWSPVSDFGAELGLIHGTERLRVALIFPHQPQLGSLTLIREHLQGTDPPARPALRPDQLLGTWVGQATTVLPDWQPDSTLATRLTVRSVGPGQIEQTLRFGDLPPIQTQARQVGSTLQFDQGQQPVTVLLLPGGASVTFPTAIQAGKPLFLEAGWLISASLRQRLIRTYNQQGTLTGLTLVHEQRQPDSSDLG
jgi:hypothetical protein